MINQARYAPEALSLKGRIIYLRQVAHGELKIDDVLTWQLRNGGRSDVMIVGAVWRSAHDGAL